MRQLLRITLVSLLSPDMLNPSRLDKQPLGSPNSGAVFAFRSSGLGRAERESSPVLPPGAPTTLERSNALSRQTFQRNRSNCESAEVNLLTDNADVVDGHRDRAIGRYGYVRGLLDGEVVAGSLPDHVEPVDERELKCSRRCRREVCARHAGGPVLIASSQSEAGDALRAGLLGEVEPARLIERCARQKVQVSRE